MQAHSGVDPQGAYFSFLKKDPIKNIDVARDNKPKCDIPTEYGFMKDRVPSGTQTFTFLTNKLSKNGSLDRASIARKEMPRNKTDHVSYDPPQANRPQ